MNKIIKLSAAIFLGAALCFTTAQAATLNTDSADYPTIQVVNYTKNSSCSTCWSSSVTADAGDIITFKIFYHNTGSDNAAQTRLRVDLPSGTFNSQSINGQVWATNAPAALGTVQVNLTSSQSLSVIPGNVYWYKYSTLTTLPFGQTGNEAITAAGLNIGDVAPGAINAGYVLIRARVSGTATNSDNSNALLTSGSVVTNAASSISSNSAILNGAVDTTNQAANTWFEYGTNINSLVNYTQTQIVGLNFTVQNFDYALGNLSSNTTYYFRAVSQNNSGIRASGLIQSFTTGGQGNNNSNNNYYYGSVPTVITNPASSVNLNSANLSVTVDANNYNTDYWFEYGTTNSFGNTTEYRNIGTFDYELNLNAYISGLLSNTTYYFRGVARNTQGITYGNTLPFTTSQNNTTYNLPTNRPTAITASAMFINQSSALLNGTIIANGALTTGWFEWSDQSDFSANTSRTTSQTMGQGLTETYYSYLLSGLTTGKTYYFRIVAQNAYGISYGETKNFIPQLITATNVSNPTTGSTQAIQNSDEKILELSSSFDIKSPDPGDEVIFTLEYKNLTENKLSGALLKLALPNEVEYINSSFSNVAKEGNNISMKIGTIEGGAAGSVSVKFKINELTQAERMILSSIITYSAKYGNGSEILNSELDLSNSSLAASVLETLGSLFSNWFTILILGSLIGAGAYHFFGTKKKYAADAEDPLK